VPALLEAHTGMQVRKPYSTSNYNGRCLASVGAKTVWAARPTNAILEVVIVVVIIVVATVRLTLELNRGARLFSHAHLEGRNMQTRRQTVVT
jgi:hypothetical protein